MLDTTSSLIIIVVVAVATFSTRAASFLVFRKGKEIPNKVLYIGRVLPPAIIGMLVVYCLKSTSMLAYPYGIPELIAGMTVIILHVWKRNIMLSVGVGNFLFMVLIQMVFV